MREHEVPTHVQAEDRVLLWFTFPQIVALTAVCALSYGAYSYAPVGSSEVRMVLAVVLGLLGVAAVVGKIGGRRLPLVAADLLRFGLGARRYAGTPAHLVRSELPAPVQSGPGPLRLMARRARRGLGSLRRDRERRNGRTPFRPHGWFGKRRRRKGGEKDNTNLPAGKTGGQMADTRETKGRKTYYRVESLPRTRYGVKLRLSVLAASALMVAAIAVPQAVLADGPDDEGGWSSDEIEFEVPEPVPGRRLFVEGLEVSGDRAGVTLRAATGLALQVRAYGGSEGEELRFWGVASLDEGERTVYDLPLHGKAPSLTFSWEDSLGQAGALTLKDSQLPYPLPSVTGEVCNARVSSLGWTPGTVGGVIASDCESTVEEAISLWTVTGHESIAETALIDAEVAGITGTLNVMVGGSHTSVSFVPNGETRFSFPIARGEAIHGVAIKADLVAALRIPMPPLVRLTHRPERTEERTERVSLVRPGTSRTVSKTVTVTHAGGTTTQHTISARLSIPSEAVHQDVTLTIVHPEHVRAEVMERGPVTRSRGEFLEVALSVGADAPFEVLTLPEPEPGPVPAEQTPLTEEETRDLFGFLGWRWPW